jgi:NADH:ubiquinone oxidoreductase subunit E
MGSFDQSAIDRLLKRHEKGDGSLISLLQDVQDKCGYLPQEVLQYISRAREVPLSKMFCVATFYSSFSLEPRGRNLVSVCLGTACHVKNGENLFTKCSRELKLDGQAGTTSNRAFTLEKVRCLGCCSMAPVVRVNEDTHGHMTQTKVGSLLRKYRKA